MKQKFLTKKTMKKNFSNGNPITTNKHNEEINATSLNSPNPYFHITKAKGRLKLTENGVYLNNNDEFEIELFNPTQSKVLAKVYINNKVLSYGGIILKPAERVFLERYLDDNKKFKFTTYSVESGSQEVNEAIKFNGIVKVEFYNEETPIYTLGNNSSITWTRSPYYGSTIGSGHINLNGNFTNINATNTAYFSSQATNTSSSDSLSFSSNDNKKTLSKETGMVEKGSESSQSFKTDTTSRFTYYPFYTSEVQILPLSEKPLEKSDLKCYCTKCGLKKRKDSWVFCPKCGTKHE